MMLPMASRLSGRPLSLSRLPPRRQVAKTTTRPALSVPAETPLKGLNVWRDGHDPLAMPDEAYPDWLWELAPSTATAMAAKTSRRKKEKDQAGKMSAAENDEERLKRQKSQLRKVNRDKIKTTNFMKTT